MAIQHLPRYVDTVIVGNGPSALILSYILHGHIPYYKPSTPHPDPSIHQKLQDNPCLLTSNLRELFTHFNAARISYSTQALPINVLLDTLLRPLADTNPGEYESCIEWRFEEDRKISHVIVGDTNHAGGVWAETPIAESWHIGSLSYAEMLSLPGYSFEQHYCKANGGRKPPEFYRPDRREVAAYLAKYPKNVGIRDSVFAGQRLGDVFRSADGFHVGSHNIACRNLVLATGTFSHLLSPPAPLRALQFVNTIRPSSDGALLVIGSGFTAADVIVSAPSDRRIIHIFNWDPERRPSPLRACHPSAYPEYAGVYRLMKSAAKSIPRPEVDLPLRRQTSNHVDTPELYEGLPNAEVEDVSIQASTASIRIKLKDGRRILREVSRFEYVIGRRGSLTYLDETLQRELLGSQTRPDMISGSALRDRTEDSVQVAPHVFAIGSLTGDSLVRFGHGACVEAASYIMNDARRCT